MKILPVNFYKSKNYSVSYKKTPYFKGIFDTFKKTTLPLDEEIASIFKTTSILKITAKKYYIMAKKSIQKGINNDYKMYTNFSKKEGEKMLFYDIDPITNMPSSIEHIKPRNGMKTTKIFDFYQGLNSYRIQDFSNDGVIHDALLNGKNMVNFEEKDLINNKYQEYTFAKEGFDFKEVKLNNNNEKVLRTFTYNSNDPSGGIYTKLNSEGNYDIYKKIKGNWQKVLTKKTID